MIRETPRGVPTFGLNAASLRPWFVRRGLVLVPDHIRKTVMFIGTKSDDGTFQPRATAFLVSTVELDMRLGYLVTADHVVSKLLGLGHHLWLRVNQKDGTAEEVEIPDDAWWFYPDDLNRTDVAVCQINFNTDKEDVYSIGLNGMNEAMAATKEVITRHRIGVGEEVAIVGLFRSHYGQERNVPVVRIGNIAAMPEEPVKTSEYGYIDAYLIEARSLGGLSGSPVFVNMAPYRVIDGHTFPSQGSQFYLLGLIHGHFDIRNLNDDAVVDNFSDAAGNINTGIGVVVPVSKILDIICEPKRVEERRRLIMLQRKIGGGATPDFVPAVNLP